MDTPTLKELAQWAQHEASLIDAMGPTPSGFNMRLIASILTEMESSLMPRLEHLGSEIARLEKSIHNV